MRCLLNGRAIAGIVVVVVVGREDGGKNVRKDARDDEANESSHHLHGTSITRQTFNVLLFIGTKKATIF